MNPASDADRPLQHLAPPCPKTRAHFHLISDAMLNRNIPNQGPQVLSG